MLGSRYLRLRIWIEARSYFRHLGRLQGLGNYSSYGVWLPLIHYQCFRYAAVQRAEACVNKETPAKNQILERLFPANDFINRRTKMILKITNYPLTRLPASLYHRNPFRTLCMIGKSQVNENFLLYCRKLYCPFRGQRILGWLVDAIILPIVIFLCSCCWRCSCYLPSCVFELMYVTDPPYIIRLFPILCQSLT